MLPLPFFWRMLGRELTVGHLRPAARLWRVHRAVVADDETESNAGHVVGNAPPPVAPRHEPRKRHIGPLRFHIIALPTTARSVALVSSTSDIAASILAEHSSPLALRTRAFSIRDGASDT